MWPRGSNVIVTSRNICNHNNSLCQSLGFNSWLELIVISVSGNSSGLVKGTTELSTNSWQHGRKAIAIISQLNPIKTLIQFI